MKYIDIKDIKKGTANTVLGLNDADEAVLSEINIDLNEYVTENELALKGYVNTEDLDRALTEKQDRLVSGEDIKTINGESILGSGDLIIQGGSGGIQSVVAVDSYPYLSATTTDNAVELRLKMGNMLSGQGGLIDAQSTHEYLTENYYTKTEIDTQIGDINTILENIIG